VRNKGGFTKFFISKGSKGKKISSLTTNSSTLLEDIYMRILYTRYKNSCLALSYLYSKEAPQPTSLLV